MNRAEGLSRPRALNKAEELARPRGKTCRICLLARDQPPSPALRVLGKGPSLWQRLCAAHSRALGRAEGADDGALIAPCGCKGTMKFVHKGCLNLWRLNSTRRDSYHRCEQCFAHYVFKETHVSALLSHPASIRAAALGLFALWIYSWYAFVCLTHSLAGGADDASFYVSAAEMAAMGYHTGDRYFVHTGGEPDALYTGGGLDDLQAGGGLGDFYAGVRPDDSYAGARPGDLHAKDGSGDLGGSPEPAELHLARLLPYHLRAFLEANLFELTYALVIVALFDVLIVGPSLILAINMIYFIWRSIKYCTVPDLLLLTALVAFGLARTLRSINATVRALLERYVKLRCIEICDLDGDLKEGLDGNRKEDRDGDLEDWNAVLEGSLPMPTCQRLKAEGQLY